MVDTMPDRQWCPIGSLNLHTYNWERTECIWCGPNRLGSKPGRWVQVLDEELYPHMAWTTWGPLTEREMRCNE